MNNILIVGAGAVGQAYGYQFAQSGKQVSFFIKEKYRDELSQGMTLYHLNQDKKRKRPIDFRHYGLISSWQEASKIHWDQIYLCISSTAFLQFDFSGLKRVVSDDTIVVILQPGLHDYERACEHLPKEQLVQGMITLSSYHGPMPGEQLPKPGVAYWFPPMAATPFSGNPIARAAVIKTFKQANMNAVANPNLHKLAPYATAAFMVFLTALETSHWKFAELAADKPLQQQMLAAQKQAFSAVSKDTGIAPPLWQHLVSAWLVRMLLRLAPRVAALDLETFFQVHFTKVKDQTKLFMNTYIAAAQQHQIAAAELTALNQLTDD